MIFHSFISAPVGNLLCAQLSEVPDQFVQWVPSEGQKGVLGKSGDFYALYILKLISF